MSRPAEQILEFDRLREMLAGYATCAPGRRAVLVLAPLSDRAALESELALLAETVGYFGAASELGFGSLADPEPWLARLAVPGSVLASSELLEAATLLEATLSARQTFRSEAAKFPRLAALAAALPDFRRPLQAIRGAIRPNAEISDAASSKLKRIREDISKTRQQARHSLQKILRTRGDADEASYITLRNDRFVIPVRAQDRRTVPGVVHAASATGQTLFVEPLEAIELNNRLVQLAEDEAAEIARILSELTQHLRELRLALRAAVGSLAHLDSLLARARFAREFNCAMPVFTDAISLRLENARHPVLEAALRERERKIVPISLALGGSETVLVISGPNTGGKTVVLKTVGLAVLSGQSAIPVAAENAELPLADRVLADIGDEQSIAADLSTFSAHMLNLKNMLAAATERSLVLVDEIGTGTAPAEGAALAVALLEEFRARRCLTLATTHHDRLKTYASTTQGILNAAVEFDEKELRPTYRLLIGVPGVSSGIEIARRLGLPQRVMEQARAELLPQAREAGELIAYLHRSRDEMENLKRQAREERERLEAERRALRTEWVERQKQRLAELEKTFQDVVKRLEAEAARLAAEIADRRARTQMEKFATRRLRKVESAARADADAAVVAHLAASQRDLGVGESPAKRVSPQELEAGSRVRVRGFKQPVILRRLLPGRTEGLDGRSAEIEAGPLRMRVPLSDIVGLETETVAAPAASPRRAIEVHAQESEEPSLEEINVIGSTVEEATRRVDKFLDTATLASLPRVRIIHGHGTGALRRGLAEFLAAHPLVEKSYAETEDRGGAAITVVELKG